MAGEKETKIVNDIVHGIIKLPDYIRQIIDTEQFQRLRDISQLGFCKFVYPSASYSRFEHSIGTFHLASLLMTQLRDQVNVENEVNKTNEKNTKESGVEITEEDIKCVEIAALCHDLGHGPFSHSWENTLSLPSTSKFHKSHEELTVEIFEDLIKNTSGNNGKPIKDKIGLNDKMIDRIRRIILGKYDVTKDSNKRFLFEIVANKRSGLDVDKFDYLCRDSIYLGWANKNKIHDIKRIMYFLRIVKDKDGNEWRLAVRDRELFHIFDIFYYRHLLHRYGYQHKTVKAVECMIKNALGSLTYEKKLDLIKNVIEEEELERHKSEKENLTDKDLIKIFHSKEFISKACDYHIWDIMGKNYDTKKILQNIQRRNLSKLYCKLQLNNKMTPDHIFALETLLKACIKNQSVTVSVTSSNFSLSSEKGNPIIRIPFYKKDTPTEYFMFDDNDNPPPSLLKYTNEEFNLLIFTDRKIERKSEKEGLEKIIDELCKTDDNAKLKVVEVRLNDILKEKFNENKDCEIKKMIEEVIKKIDSKVNNVKISTMNLKNVIDIEEIVEEMCKTYDEEKMKDLKERLNNISKDTFEENKKIIEKINKLILAKVDSKVKDGLNEILKELNDVKCNELRKEYSFERSMY